MHLPNPLLGPFAGEEAHCQSQQKVPFPRHRPFHPVLYGLNWRACITDRHGLNGSMHQEIRPRQPGYLHVPPELAQRQGGAAGCQRFLRLVPVATAFRRATPQPKRDRSIVELVDKSNPATLPILIYDSIRSPRSLTVTRFVGRNATPT